MSKELHPSIVAVLRYFEFEHLPQGPLQEISKRFHDLAWTLAQDESTDGAQMMWGMMDLLRAKDCFVRSALPLKAEAKV